MQHLVGQVKFGDCVIDILARTVTRSGSLQTFQPKVFDLTLYLIENRERVVPHGELLEQIWGRRVVLTSGVVARTVMKARRLIGDDVRQPFAIKTIHSIGYRFVAALEQDTYDWPVRRPETASAPQVAPIQPTVAVLPFHNGTGRIDLSWIDLGLMANMIDLLAWRGQIKVLAAGDVLAAVGTDGDAISLPDAADKLRRGLNATNVIQARLMQRGEALELRYECIGPHLSHLKGTLTGIDPLGLCSRLASIVAQIDPAGVQHPAIDPERDDPFLRAAALRARQAIDAQRWETARCLLRVILDKRPDDIDASLDFGRCLARLRDPHAREVLRGLLDRARQEELPRLEVNALHCLAVFELSCNRTGEARRLLDDGLNVARQEGDFRSELELLMTTSELLAGESNGEPARHALDRATMLAQMLGNQVATARALDLRGRLTMLCGNVQGAHDDFEQAVGICEEFGLQSSTSFSWTHLGYTIATQGRMKDAATCFDKAFDFGLRSGDPVAIGLASMARILGCGTCPEREGLGSDTIERLAMSGRPGNAVITAYRRTIEAVLAARSGEILQSVALLDQAEQCCQRPYFLIRVMWLRIRMMVCLSLLEEASDLCDELSAHATTRTQRHVTGVVWHLRALIAHADGNRAGALRHLQESLAKVPAQLMRGDAAFDAAWLYLESGDVVKAQYVLDQLGGFVERALQDEYGPALLVQARLEFERARKEDAVVLQRQYCARMRSPPRSGAAAYLSAYESGSGLQGISGARVLPSMVDLVPHFDLTTRRH